MNVLQTVLDKFAHTRRAVDLRYDLEQEIGCGKPSVNCCAVGLLVLVSHGADRNLQRTIVDRTDQRVDSVLNPREECSRLPEFPQFFDSGFERVARDQGEFMAPIDIPATSRAEHPPRRAPGTPRPETSPARPRLEAIVPCTQMADVLLREGGEYFGLALSICSARRDVWAL